MAAEKEEGEPLERASAATTKRTKAKLSELKSDPARFCHRDPEALQPEALQSLTESLILEGLQVPVEYYVGGDGTHILVKGHRRVAACRLLAAKNEPGFTPDMEIEAIEVQGATLADLLVRSVSDNEVRLNLDRIGRIRVSKKMFDAGVPSERAARAMGVSVKTYDRDLEIARHPFMFQHVIDGSIAPTHASDLLFEAGKVGRVREMQEDLDAWISRQKAVIREKEKLRKARDGKELPPGDRQVKKYLPNHLVAHWIGCLREGKRFDENARWTFAAGIEPESEQLHISSVTLDLAKAPLDRLAKVASKLSLLSKQLAPYLRKAHDKEAAANASEAVGGPYDLGYLRDLGMEDTARELEAEAGLTGEPDGEATPQEEPEEREERDLTEEIKLPEAESEPEPAPAPAPATARGKPATPPAAPPSPSTRATGKEGRGK